MVCDVLLLSYLDKIGLSLMDEAGQTSAYLYSEARLYKGASLALLSQSATTRSTRVSDPDPYPDPYSIGPLDPDPDP
jgi:hypothetical protein